MAVIGNVDIILGARTEALDRGLSRSQARMARFNSQVDKLSLEVIDHLESTAGMTEQQAKAQGAWSREIQRTADRMDRMNTLTRERNRLAKEFGRTSARSSTNLATARRETSGMNAMLVGTSSRLLGITALVSGAASSIGQSADIERSLTAMEVLTGSASNARNLMGQIREIAASTPITFQGGQDAVRTMLLFNLPLSEVMENLRMLGDITGGDTERMKSLALAFAQASAAGRLQGQDLRQMIDAGFNPLQEIARKTGRTLDDLRSSGPVSAQEMRDAFISATAEGGKFNGMLERLGDTTGGTLAEMQSQLQVTAAELGDGLGPIVKEIGGLFEDWQPVLDGATSLVGVMGQGLSYLLAISRDLSNFVGGVGFGLALDDDAIDLSLKRGSDLSELFKNTNALLDAQEAKQRRSAETTGAIASGFDDAASAAGGLRTTVDGINEALGEQARLTGAVAEAQAKADADRESRIKAYADSQASIAKAIESQIIERAKQRFGADGAKQFELALATASGSKRELMLENANMGVPLQVILSQADRQVRESLAQLDRLQKRNARNREAPKLAERRQKQADSILQKFELPQVAMRREINLMLSLFREGRLDFGTLVRGSRDAAQRAQKELSKSQPKRETPDFGFLQKGSVEAFSAARDNEQNRKQASLIERSNVLLENVNAMLERVAQNTAAIQTVGNAG